MKRESMAHLKCVAFESICLPTDIEVLRTDPLPLIGLWFYPMGQPHEALAYLRSAPFLFLILLLVGPSYVPDI